MRINLKTFAILVVLVESSTANSADLKVLTWKKVATYPHDPEAYTQGLTYWEPGILAESTGLYGRSSIRRVELKTGKVLSQATLGNQMFAEGLAKIGKHFVQLTWREHVALKWVWDAKTGWQRDGEWNYEGEGWGLASASDGRVVMSNGSAKLTWRDSKTFAASKTVAVAAGKQSQDLLNELEMVQGHVFANRWHTSQIVRINASSGVVDGILDIHELIPGDIKGAREEAVANGIAWDPRKKVFYVTGKLWPVLYEIKVEGY